ncbi:MAG: RNA polymerase sigma factor [Muribaculaceae bacterium]|nr:RNA polymerase sigma factor [Bacteroidales bacterium]MDE6041900.1 RNA polymerase sigma factor [Muribaculaceae bacterium]
MSSVKFQTNLMNLQNNLLSFAYMLTSNRDDAYELLQDTTLKALDNEEKYSANTNFKGWVFTIMRNLFINKYRHASKSVVEDESADTVYLINLSHEGTAEVPEDTYSASDLTNAINCLSDELRIPYSMHVSGYHYQEIADHLNVSVSVVKARIKSAHRSIGM